MIVFDLRCSAAHVFEVWFRSSAAFEDQQARGLLSCAICGDRDIVKAVMAPNVAAKGNNRAAPAAAPPSPLSPPPVGPLSPQAMKAALQALSKAQSEALANSTWVGRAFAEQARAMHAGEVAESPIHGQTTPREARSLAEEGVPIAPLPLPVVPPDSLN